MNKKNSDNHLEEKVIMNSIGLLNTEEREEFNSIIQNSEELNKKMISEFNNLVSLFPKLIQNSFNNISPTSKVKGKIFEKINTKESSPLTAKEKGFDFIYSNSDGWIQHPIEGIKVKQLAVNVEKGYVMLLMKVAAGTNYPPHHHSGAEECYVIEGDLFAEGKTLGPGDFHHADGGSDHDPLHTKNGCMLLLVVDPDDYK